MPRETKADKLKRTRKWARAAARGVTDLWLGWECGAAGMDWGEVIRIKKKSGVSNKLNPRFFQLEK